VYRAVHIASEQLVAIKQISLITKKESVQQSHLIMLAREVHLLYKFGLMEENSYTIKVLDMMVNEDAYEDATKLKEIYIVTAFEEIDVAQIFKSKSPLTFDQVKIIAYNLLISLRYVHKAGVIHRDLKPNNVLINPHCQVFLCDFGWSRTTINDSKEVQGKKKRSLSPDFCTRYYRPPEIILESQNYDYRVDVWSYGCIIGELYRWAIKSETKELKNENIVLFRGDSCYPISPLPIDESQEEEEKEKTISNQD
jgi:serine/threonine protein kinase